MKNALSLLIVFLFASNFYAQKVDMDKDFVYTSSNKLVYANLVKYKSRFLAADYILVDSIKYSPSKVKFYRSSDEGFFANTKYLHGYGKSAFAKRVSKGKINLFHKEVTSYSPGPTMPMGGGFGMSFGMMNTNTIQYYNKGFGDLKKANYRNLAVDLADNPKSMVFLNKYKKRRNTATTLFVAGGIVALTGLVGFISKTSNTEGKPPQNTSINTIAMVSGVGSALVGSFVIMGNKDRIEDAIDEYNKE